jgi:hypothetical protein
MKPTKKQEPNFEWNKTIEKLFEMRKEKKEIKPTAGIDKFSNRLDEIFEQGRPTKAQILDAYNKTVKSEPAEGAEEYTDAIDVMTWFAELKGIKITEFDDIDLMVCRWAEAYSKFHAQRLADKMVVEIMKKNVLKLSDEIDKVQSERLLSDKERVDKTVADKLVDEYQRGFEDGIAEANNNDR